jgi:hypothetical protein
MIALSIEEVGAIVPQQGKNESNQKSAPTAHTLRNPLRLFLEVSYHNLFGLENYSFHQKSDQNYQRIQKTSMLCYANQLCECIMGNNVDHTHRPSKYPNPNDNNNTVILEAHKTRKALT